MCIEQHRKRRWISPIGETELTHLQHPNMGSRRSAQTARSRGYPGRSGCQEGLSGFHPTRTANDRRGGLLSPIARDHSASRIPSEMYISGYDAQTGISFVRGRERSECTCESVDAGSEGVAMHDFPHRIPTTLKNCIRSDIPPPHAAVCRQRFKTHVSRLFNLLRIQRCAVAVASSTQFGYICTYRTMQHASQDATTAYPRSNPR